MENSASSNAESPDTGGGDHMINWAEESDLEQYLFYLYPLFLILLFNLPSNFWILKNKHI